MTEAILKASKITPMAASRFWASVIILGHNGLSYIDWCLGSVLDQDFPLENYEVIWADNGSSDGSAEYVTDHFPTVRVLRFDSNLGFAKGNNQAAQKARGRYLVFLNQDTIVHRTWLRALVEAMVNHEDIAACQANMLMPWHTGFDSFDRVNYPDTVHFADISRYGYIEYRECPMWDEPVIPCAFLSGASFIIDRHIVERLPYIFDPLFITYSEDLDFSLRLKKLGYQTAVVPHSVVYHLQYSTVSNPNSAMCKAYLSTRNRFYAYYKFLPIEDFIRFCPRLIVGSVLKVNQLRFGFIRETLIKAAMVPISLMALGGCILMALGYTKNRS
jgi:GT2 family glycosyltransferase